MSLFHEVVESVKQTSPYAPITWEGKLKDGRMFYVRSSRGYATLGIGTSKEDAEKEPGTTIMHNEYGSVWDTMDSEEFYDVFGLLYHKHESLNPWVVTAAHVYHNGEVNLEVWGTFLSKVEADQWIENNKNALSMVGTDIQVKELRPVDRPTTILP